MTQRKRSIADQHILACPVCGTPARNLCECRKGLALMTKAQAANLAINYTFRDLPDYKSRAAGETE